MVTAIPKISDFTIKKKLGEGSYSHVSLAVRHQDGLEYALK
jgi:serine/threonine protein kinase